LNPTRPGCPLRERFELPLFDRWHQELGTNMATTDEKRIDDRVKEIVCDQLGVKADEVKPSSSFV